MLLDNITFSGIQAYLKDSNDNTNLAVISPNEGHSIPLGKGIVIDVSGISLHLEGDDLYSLLKRDVQPFLKIEVIKEMFPGLFKDPYQHRVHLISGLDDFNRGQFINCRVMEIEGFPTLTSLGTASCKWVSEVYSFQQTLQPLQLSSAAWDLASPRLVPDEGFSYSIFLHVWNTGNAISNPPSVTIPLAENRKPGDVRFIDSIEDKANDVIAYQVQIEATVNHDSYIKERFLGKFETSNIGRPLFRSLSLLEPVEPAFQFYSLKELLLNCPSYHFMEEPNERPKILTAAVSITAALEENESIRLHVLTNKLSLLEARLNARVRVKPPVIDK